MRSRLLLVLTPCILAACTQPSEPKPTAPVFAEEVQISMDIRTFEDELATQRSTAILRITGAVQQEEQVYEGLGTLQRVDPALYEDATIVGIWSAWWAGGGDDIRVRRTGSGITVDRREAEEGDVSCRPWETVTHIAVPAGAELRVVAEGPVAGNMVCAGGSADAAIGTVAKNLAVRLEAAESEDDDGVVRTNAVLYLTGATDRDVPLGAISGRLTYVDPASYAAPQGMEVLAVFSAWLAGAGSEIRIARSIDGNTLIIDRFDASEGEEGQQPSETCASPIVLAEVTLGANADVTLEGVVEPVPASMLGWCAESFAPGGVQG